MIYEVILTFIKTTARTWVFFSERPDLQHETGELYVVMIAVHTFTAVSDAATLFFFVNTQIFYVRMLRGFFFIFSLPSNLNKKLRMMLVLHN